MQSEHKTTIEPSHIQITPLANGQWGWVVWFAGDAHPADREGEASTLAAAIDAVREASDAR